MKNAETRLRALEKKERGDSDLMITKVIHEIIAPDENGPRLSGVWVRGIEPNAKPFKCDRLDDETESDFRQRSGDLYRLETGESLGEDWGKAA